MDVYPLFSHLCPSPISEDQATASTPHCGDIESSSRYYEALLAAILQPGALPDTTSASFLLSEAVQ